jgi:hypothetical protein
VDVEPLFSHCEYNAKREAGFLTLSHFLSHKIFCQSDPTQVVFEQFSGVSCKTVSCNCWWSQYNIFHVIYSIFACMTSIMVKNVQKHAAHVSSAKMLQDPEMLFYIRIELSDFIEGLMNIIQFLYGAKSDDRLVFNFDKMINESVAFHPHQGLCNLYAVNQIIKEAMTWVEDMGY